MRRCCRAATVAVAVLLCLAPVAAPYSHRTTKASNALWVDVNEVTDTNTGDCTEDAAAAAAAQVEQSSAGEVGRLAGAARADALLLYTEYQARAASAMKQFIRNVTQLKSDAVFGQLRQGEVDRAPAACRDRLLSRLGRAVYNAQRAATFTGENHHKFFLGHMIVFRMHLNKAEDYIQKCNHLLKTCGKKCENSPKMVRWRYLAGEEVRRVQDEISASRRAFRDLLQHALRRLRTLRRHADIAAHHAISEFQQCLQHPNAKSEDNATF